MLRYWWEKITNTRKFDPSVKILIIEDNPVDAKLFEKAVDICGFSSLVAYDGKMGIEMAWAYRPSLVILDYKLPDMNGAQVLEYLRANKETSAESVLVLSVLDSSDVVINSFMNGADQYFQKPVDLNLLVKEIRQLIHRPHC